MEWKRLVEPDAWYWTGQRGHIGVDVVRDKPMNVRMENTYWTKKDVDVMKDIGIRWHVLPYIPFLSNCRGYDSFLPFSKLIEEHPDCTLEEKAEGVPVWGILTGQTSGQNADMCKVDRYEAGEISEDVNVNRAGNGKTIEFLNDGAGESPGIGTPEGNGRTSVPKAPEWHGEGDPVVEDREWNDLQFAVPNSMMQRWPGKLRFHVDDGDADGDFELVPDKQTKDAFIHRHRGVDVNCYFDEDAYAESPGLRWFESPTGTNLFYLLRDPFPFKGFMGYQNYNYECNWICVTHDDPNDPCYGGDNLEIGNAEIDNMRTGLTSRDYRRAKEPCPGQKERCEYEGLVRSQLAVDNPPLDAEGVPLSTGNEFLDAIESEMMNVGCTTCKSEDMAPQDLCKLPEPVTDSSAASTPWGRSEFNIGGLVGTEAFIPVTTAAYASDVKMIPRIMKLQVEYWQVVPSLKRLIFLRFYYFDRCSIAETNKDVVVANGQNVYACIGTMKYGESAVECWHPIWKEIETGEFRTDEAPNNAQGMVIEGGTLGNKGSSGVQCLWHDFKYSTKDFRDYRYNFEFMLVPLDWGDLMNRFAFDAIFYSTVFTGIALLTGVLGGIVYLLLRIFAPSFLGIKHPPELRFFGLWKLIAYDPAIGVIYGMIVLFLGCFWPYFHYKMFRQSIQRPLSMIFPPLAPYLEMFTFAKYTGDYLFTSVLNVYVTQKFRYGRIGSALITQGALMISQGCVVYVPAPADEVDWDKLLEDGGDIEAAMETMKDEDGNDVPRSRFWTPWQWKRSHIFFSSYGVQIILIMVMEFSYSPMFANNIYLFIVGFKILQMFVDIMLVYLLREILLICPIMVVIESTEIMITMGAEDLIDFISSYVVECFICMIERLWLDPWLKEFTEKWPLRRHHLRKYFSKQRGQMSREAKMKEEQELAHINDEIKRATEGVEPVIDMYSVYSCEAASLWMTPFVNLFLILYNEETQIPALYGIKETDLSYYMIFGFISVLGQLIFDVFLLHAQELIHGWKVYEYVAYQKYRFSVREFRWQMTANVVDESINPPMQTADAMCFSSQYFFMTTFHSSGVLVSMMGISIQLRESYNPFGDGTLLVNAGFVFLVTTKLMRPFLMTLANLCGVWVRKSLDGTIDDDIGRHPGNFHLTQPVAGS
jgi:hypothetical protein